MTIAIDARVLGTSRALDRYTRNLIIQFAELGKQHKFIIFVNENVVKEKLNIPEPEHFTIAALPSTHTLLDHFTFCKRIKKFNPQVLLHPDNRSFLVCNIPQITTLHDLTPQKFPGLVLSKDPLLFFRQRLYFELQNEALKKCKFIITVSKNTKKDVLKILKYPSDKIYPIYEGVESHFKPIPYARASTTLKKYSVEKPYIFYLGGFGKHKNVLNLVKAFNCVKDDYKDMRLVLGGKASDANSSGQNTYSDLVAYVKGKNLKRRVDFVGFISEEDLPSIYSNAKVFVFPSKYEGFGFPPLEGMACGTPVICSNAASLPEIGGKAVLYAQSVDEIEDALRKIFDNAYLAKELRDKGIKQAKKFTWRKTAKETLKVIESCM